MPARREASYALAEMERLNLEALATLTTRDNVQLRTFPADLVAAARTQAVDVLGELAGKSAGAQESPRLLYGVPRQDRRLVAHLAQGGAGGAGRVNLSCAGIVPAMTKPLT